MPLDQPSDDHFKQMRQRIHRFILKNARWITIFILTIKPKKISLALKPFTKVHLMIIMLPDTIIIKTP